jgi:DNA primase
MGRIPEEQLDRLKREVPLEQLVQRSGVELRRVGADLVGRCPFHEGDNEPSLHVSPAPKNLWHCFGCGLGGSNLDWLIKTEKLSVRHAIEILQRLDGQGPAPASAVKALGRHSAALEQTQDDQKLLLQVVDFYHRELLKSPEAIEYLQRRGLHHPEMISHFRLGYASRSLAYQLPKSTNAKMRQRLKELGVLRAETGHEHLRGCVAVPLFDESGQVVGMYGRKIHPAQRGTPSHLYLPGPHRGVWNAEALSTSREVILCEALLDALAMWCHGFYNVTASFGASGFTEEMMEALRRHGVQRVLIAYDRDEAGERGAAALAPKLQEAGIAAFRVELPWKMDVNEYALKVTPAAKSLALVLRAARFMGQGPAPALQSGSSPAELALRAGEPAPAESAELQASAPAQEQTSPEPAEPQLQQMRGFEPAPPAPSPAPDLPSLAAQEAAGQEPSAPPKSAVSVLEARGEGLEGRFGDRLYRVRGFEKNTSLEQMRINLFCGRDEMFHLDTLDMYSARQRAVYIKVAASELGVEEQVVKRDLGRVLLALEELHEKRVREELAPKDQAVQLSEPQREAALELLCDPHLCERIVADFERCGVVGEKTNKLLGYLAAVSRKLERPLGVLIQSSSAAGKSSLLEAILALMPEEETVKYSAMTGQALYYMGERGLKHKILAIAEEQGAERASYALKLLLSEGRLSIASTGKDPVSGKLITFEYGMEGPVMLLCTTTAAQVDEELQNRCLVFVVDEGREQTRAIHELQRRRHSLSGLWAEEERASVLELHQNAQRLLRPLKVINPYAEQLTFLDDRTRTRRDHLKYLSLIESIALLHQYQRPLRSASRLGQEKSYIEVEPQDIELANRLASEALGRSLDELPPQSRRLLMIIDQMVQQRCGELAVQRSDYRFRCREVRERCGWGNTQLKAHMGRLVEMEYLLVHRAARGQSFVYELLYEGQGKDGQPFLMKLLDPSHFGAESKSAEYEQKWSGQKEERSAPGRPRIGGKPAPGRPSREADATGHELAFLASWPKNAHLEDTDKGPPYAQVGRNGKVAEEVV